MSSSLVMAAFAFLLSCSTYVLAYALIDSSVDEGEQVLGELLLTMVPGVPLSVAIGMPLQERTDNEAFVRKAVRTHAARLADQTAQHVVSQELVSPSLDLKPRPVAENALYALSQGRIQSWSKFLDPSAKLRRHQWTLDPILKEGFQFTILSEVKTSPERYMFQVRVKQRSASSGFYGFNSLTMKPRDYLVELSRDSCFDIGQTVMHALDYQIGMIIGSDPSYNMPDEWPEECDINALPRGREQPFYMVLPDSRGTAGDVIRYVAEDLLLECKMEHLFQHPLKDTFVKKKETTSETAPLEGDSDAPNPQNLQTAGCWLVHDIRPWD